MAWNEQGQGIGAAGLTYGPKCFGTIDRAGEFRVRERGAPTNLPKALPDSLMKWRRTFERNRELLQLLEHTPKISGGKIGRHNAWKIDRAEQFALEMGGHRQASRTKLPPLHELKPRMTTA